MTDIIDHDQFRLVVWRLFFDLRAVGLALLAVVVLVPGVPLDPRLALLTAGVALPANLALRELIVEIRMVPWIVLVIDSAILAIAIAVVPASAPTTGILLLASTCMIATAGWRPTVLAILLGSPFMIAALARHAPDDLFLVMGSFLATSIGVTVFVSLAVESLTTTNRADHNDPTHPTARNEGGIDPRRSRVRPEVDSYGEPTTVRGTVVDITDEARVHEKNRNLAELVERVPVGLLVARGHDIAGQTTFTTVTTNPAYQDIVGIGATSLANAPVGNSLDGPRRDELHRLLREALRTGEIQRAEEAGDLCPGGNRVLSLEAFPISADLVGLNVLDVTDRVTAAATLRRQALHDALTGLPNRALLDDRLRHAIAAAGRDGRSVGLLMLDLNQFKDVNDTLGHDQGDRLLQVIATRLRETLRAVDTVARLGGDEFAVLLTDDVSPRRALGAAERALSCFEEPIDVDGISIQCGASLGVAIYPDHGDCADTLRKHADMAMYVAKRKGGGIDVFDPDRDQPNVERISLLGQLREALNTGDLVVHYQPVVDLASGSIDRVEALVRWNHRDRGLIPPSEFIDLAEVSGLIRPLTKWMVEQAANDISDFHAMGHTFGVSINISVRNLFESGLVESIHRVLEAFGLPGHYITLELTEIQVMDDPLLAHGVLGRLGEFGVRSSIDDFGTGHSSLSNLQSLPISEVKVDRSFVQSMATGDEAATTIVRSIISLGHNLGLEVVAEGVETNETLTQLSLLGCDRAQGFLFAPPLPRDELLSYLESSRQSAMF